MTSIPKNNLNERMVKLGYNPNIVKLVPPVLDFSAILKREKPPLIYQTAPKAQLDFKPLATVNIDDWSDFEEDE